jgi:hypothetical protein
MGMRRLLAIGLLAGIASADVAAADVAMDRGAIDTVVALLNERRLSKEQRAALFTTNASQETNPWETFDRPWSEVTRPVIHVESVVFLNARLALVSGMSVQYGSAFGKRETPLTLVMVKEAQGNWKIRCLGPALASR